MDGLIIMTRVPIPNKTKTRLMDIYNGVECASLHKCFLKDVFKVAENLKDNLHIFLSYTPEDGYHLLEDLKPDYIKSFPQVGNNLGDRMHNCISYLHQLKYDKIVLIGSDIPEIKEEYIKNALINLDTSDICLGPTYDGGYYLVGVKKPCMEIFHTKINWGKKTVFNRTVEIAENIGLKVSFTNKCRDIDTKEDIRDFMNGLKEEDYPANTLSYFKSNWRECLGEI